MRSPDEDDVRFTHSRGKSAIGILRASDKMPAEVLESILHIPTHILSGWCVANLVPLTARQRLCCTIAATAADVDGLSLAFGQEAYWDYHHALDRSFVRLVRSFRPRPWMDRSSGR